MLRYLPAAWLAIAVAPASAAGPIQSYDEYKSWLVACDNTLTCVAKGFDDGAARAEIVVTQGAGPRGALSVSIAAETRFGIRDLAIDGVPLALPPTGWALESGTDGGTLTGKRPADIRALLNRLRQGTRLTLGKTIAVPLAGLSAALLRIDERQGRIGGTTALVRSGGTPATSVPSAPPVPYIPNRPVTARLGAGEAQHLITAVRKGQRAVLVREDCSDSTGPLEAEAFALDDRRALVFLPCLMGAYQGSSVAFIAQRGGPAQQRVVAPTPYLGAGPHAAARDMFTEADFDPETGMLAMVAKGRGLADCGMSVSWIWDGRAFRLADMSLQNACGGRAAGDWPTLFRSRQ